MSAMDPLAILTIFVALGLGGFVKGATGSGAPLIAVPVIAAFYDVRLAIVVMVLPNIVLNVMQVWSFRQHLTGRGVALRMCVGAVPGMVIGTLLLSRLPAEALKLGLGAILVIYLVLRVVDPDFSLGQRMALRLSLPTGVLGGILQGAAGMSGPLAMLFLSTQGLARPVFIATISVFYLTNAVVQAPALWVEGLLTAEGMALSAIALVPVLLAMPLGARVGRRMSTETFNRVILVLIALLAVRLLWRGFA
jgi:hypothetical protein